MADETAATRNAVVTKNAVIHDLDDWKYHVALTWGDKKRLLRQISAWTTKVENWRKEELARLRDAADGDPVRLEAVAALDPEEDLTLPTDLTLEQFDILGEALKGALVKVEAPDGGAGPLDPDELRDDHAWKLMQAMARIETPEEVMDKLPMPAE